MEYKYHVLSCDQRMVDYFWPSEENEKDEEEYILPEYVHEGIFNKKCKHQNVVQNYCFCHDTKHVFELFKSYLCVINSSNIFCVLGEVVDHGEVDPEDVGFLDTDDEKKQN